MSQIEPPPQPQQWILSGASGLIGAALRSRLERDGCQVRTLVRANVSDPRTQIAWDPQVGRLDPTPLEGADACVHLGGASIAGWRWTKRYKRILRDSRILSTSLLSRTLAGLRRPPRVLLCGSAIGYYGDRGDERLDERSPPGVGFLPDLCQEWEQAASAAREAGIRVVHLRLGLVLSAAGGALPSMLLPFRLGIGGRAGDGRQYMSWIALRDVVAAIAFLAERETVSGPVNLVAPNAERNLDVARTIGRILRRPAWFPTPALAIRLALGEMGRALLLSSSRVVPTVLEAAGFQFGCPTLERALRAELGR